MPAIGSGEKGAGSTFPISASVTKAPTLLLFYCTSARSVLVWFLSFCIFFFCRSLVDTVYALKDEVKELKQVI